MLNRLFAVLLSITTFISSLATFDPARIIDTITDAVYGVPYTANAVKADFLDDIGQNDIGRYSEDVGYVNNLVTVILDKGALFSEKIALFSSCGGLLVGWHCAADIYVVKYPLMKPEQVQARCEKLLESNCVVFASPCLAHRYSEQGTPNDPFGGDDIWKETAPSGENWWLEAVGARQAWDYSQELVSIKVGIVDSGFDTEHEELKGKISFPSARYARQNIPTDHGTHVSGIVAARQNNGVGISGICPNAELICVDWSPEPTIQYWITDIKILFGFIDTVKAGAKVINFSLGSSGSVPEGSFRRNAIYNWWDAIVHSLAIASLLSKGYDFVVVQAAGNGNEAHIPIEASQNGTFSAIREGAVFTGTSGVSFQDILDRIIIVAACETNNDGTFSLSSFSNVGSRVDIAAPGSHLYSTYPNNEYGYMSGTSMATPVVTGVAALVWSVNPAFTGAQVKELVTRESSTDSIAMQRTDYFFTELEYSDMPMVNAMLAVENAIMAAKSAGRVSGTADETGSYVLVDVNGVDRRFTCTDNGTFDFVVDSGDRTVKVYDSQDVLIAEQTLNVAANSHTVIEF